MIEIDKDEHIIFEVRKHWLVLATEVIVLVILALLPMLVVSFMPSLEKWLNELQITGLISLFMFMYSSWLFILWIVGFIFWTNYYLDVWIITSKKIIDVEQHGLFKREISIMNLEKIQDITFKIHGFIPTLFNYGDIKVQTAGAVGSFLIQGIPNPSLIQIKLNEAIVLNGLKKRKK